MRFILSLWDAVVDQELVPADHVSSVTGRNDSVCFARFYYLFDFFALLEGKSTHSLDKLFVLFL